MTVSPQDPGATGRVGLWRSLALLAQPGLGVKRWALVGGLGVGLLTLGLSLAPSIAWSQTLVDWGRTVTLAQVLPDWWRSLLLAGVGVLLLALAAVQLFRAMGQGAAYARRGEGLLQGLSVRRVRRGGPRVVAIGGGTGLATLLRGLKYHTDEITAVVTVTDDGGSSGRLRTGLGMPPPGDARQCLVALSESESLMEELFSYRFTEGVELQGHSMGNLLLAALTARTGSLHEALEASARLLAIRGRVVPSSLGQDLVLRGRTETGRELVGESAVTHAGETIAALWVEPESCTANPAVLEALREADAVVIGPGSLYTSVLPNFLVPGLAAAVAAASAPKIFVCNVATQVGETDGMSASDHLTAFEHWSGVAPSHVVVNTHHLPIPPESGQRAVVAERPERFAGAYVPLDLVSTAMSTRHDPERLARALISLARSPDQLPVLDRPGAVGTVLVR